MTHGDAILRAILEEPRDDLHRLAFADWLEEQGDDARAEFVRVQIRLGLLDAGKIEHPHGFGAVRLTRRERELVSHLCLVLHGETPFGTRCVVTADDQEKSSLPVLLFRRGFASEVRCPLQTWLDHGGAVVRSQPIERMVITDREVDPALMADHLCGWTWTDDLSWDRDETGLRFRCNRACLPRRLHRECDRLHGEWWVDARPDGHWTPALALSALGHAALTLSRRAAGLPELPWTPNEE